MLLLDKGVSNIFRRFREYSLHKRIGDLNRHNAFLKRAAPPSKGSRHLLVYPLTISPLPSPTRGGSSPLTGGSSAGGSTGFSGSATISSTTFSLSAMLCAMAATSSIAAAWSGLAASSSATLLISALVSPLIFST